MTGAKRAQAAGPALALTFGCAFAHLTEAQSSPANAPPLRAGETHRAMLRASDRVSFVIEIEGRDDYLLRVDQGGLDLVVTLTERGGRSESFNSPLLRNEAELVLLADRPAGRYEIALHTDEHSDTVATPAVELIALAPSGDSRERDALRAMTSGAAANFAGGDEAWRAAATEYERAAELWRDLGRRREEAQALFAVAMIEFWQLYAWQRSADLAERAATLYTALGEPSLAASAVELRGSAIVEQALEAGENDSVEAESLFARALGLFEEARLVQEGLGNDFALGSIVNFFGYVAYNRGEHDAARGYYRQAAALLAAAGEPGAELNPLANLAVLDVEAGRVAAAIDTLERILVVLPPGKQERYRSDTLFNLGTSYRLLGYTDRALQTFATALEIQARGDDMQGRGRSLRGIGETYYALGELETATQYLEQALVLAVQTNDGRMQAAIHRALGNIAALEGDHATALERHQTAIRFATSATDRAYLELLIARDLINLGRAAEAADLAAAASATAETAGSDRLTATALHELGRAEAQQAPALASAAVAKLERAASLFSAMGLESEHAAVLHSLGILARDRGDLKTARTYGAGAIAAAESLRLRVADPELRAAAAATRRGYYETQIDTLMRLHATQNDGSDAHLRAAFGLAERSRARMLADLLAEAAVDLRGKLDSSVLDREKALVERLAERRIERERLMQQSDSDASRAELAAIAADLASLENQLNLLEIEMRDADPRRGALASAATPSVEQAQAMLDERTALLEYALGTPSYVFVVTRERVAAVTLADRAIIETAARDALANLSTLAANGAAPDLTALVKLVLEPVAPYLDKPRLLLALDGALQYVPFAALPSPANNHTGRLAAAHDIVVIPSLSAVAALPARGGARQKTLAIFADPVVTAADPRLPARASVAQVAASASNTLLERTSVDRALERLPATSYEAQALAGLVPAEQRFVASGFDASRETVLGATLEQYRYVHFATHGLVDARYPGLSALVLSQFDEQGAERNGFLRLHDIYNLQLDADVAVLSACETALGRDIRGEGLVGLTQGFMYAGARSVVASLWQVPDRAAAELMTRFYRHLLQGDQLPSAALRRAQSDLAAERRFADPYFWSGFVLIGDWR
jgi:CHAT domain-containing protein/tetratricopeptide (TPR) repeat protein